MRRKEKKRKEKKTIHLLERNTLFLAVVFVLES